MDKSNSECGEPPSKVTRLTADHGDSDEEQWHTFDSDSDEEIDALFEEVYQELESKEVKQNPQYEEKEKLAPPDNAVDTNIKNNKKRRRKAHEKTEIKTRRQIYRERNKRCQRCLSKRCENELNLQPCDTSFVCLKCWGKIFSNGIYIHLKGKCTPGPPKMCPHHNEYAFEIRQKKLNLKNIKYYDAQCIKCLVDLKNMRYYGAQCIEGHENFEKDKLLVSYTNNGQKEEDYVNKYTLISVNNDDGGGDSTCADFESNNCDGGDDIRVSENVQDDSSCIAAGNNARSKGVARKALRLQIEKKKEMRKIKLMEEKRKRQRKKEKRKRERKREREEEKKEKEREIIKEDNSE